MVYHNDGDSSSQSNQIASLITYARSNYESNPTEALSALMQALTLNSGQESADQAMQRLRTELGDEVASHVEDRHRRMERALQIIEELLSDQSTILYERGQQDLLRQTMEDGSSVVCSKCNAVVSSARWQQHQSYWCEAIMEVDDE